MLLIHGVKKALSRLISNSKIDNLYNFGLKNGALGGKLLGAGVEVFYYSMLILHKMNHFKKNEKKYYFTSVTFSEKGSNSFIIKKLCQNLSSINV